MLERGLNAFWILLGAGAAMASWSLGLIGTAGPDSGFFPLIAALIVLGSGLVLLVRPDTAARAGDLAARRGARPHRRRDRRARADGAGDALSRLRGRRHADHDRAAAHRRADELGGLDRACRRLLGRRRLAVRAHARDGAAARPLGLVSDGRHRRPRHRLRRHPDPGQSLSVLPRQPDRHAGRRAAGRRARSPRSRSCCRSPSRCRRSAAW